MVSVSNYVNSLNTNNVSAPVQNSGPVNTSIFNEKQQNIGGNTNNEQLSLKQKLEKEINTLLSQYDGITFEDLQSIQKELKLDQVKHTELTEEKIQKFVKFLKEQLDAAVVDGKIDKNKLKSNIKSRVEEYNFLNNGLVGMLVKQGYLKNIPEDAKSLNDIDKNVLKKAVNDFLTDQINSHKQNGNLSKEQIQQQKERFKVLLAGTSDEDKVLLWDAVKDVLKENGFVKEAITETIKSYVNSGALKRFISRISKEDLDKLGINLDDLASSIDRALEGKSIEDFTDVLDSIMNVVSEFYKKNHEIIQSYQAKIKNFQNQNPDKELTDEILLREVGLTKEELEVYKACSNLEAMYSGSSVSAAKQNYDISTYYNQYIDIVGEFGAKKLQEFIKSYVENHKDELNVSSEEFYKKIDDVTKGEFSGNTESYKSAEEATAQASDVGFKMPQSQLTPAQSTPLASVQEFYAQNAEKEDNKITIESTKYSNTGKKFNNNVSFSGIEAIDIEEAIKNKVFKSTTDAVCQALKKYKDLSQSAKQWVSDKLGTMSKTYQKFIFKKGLAGAVIRFLAEKKLITSEELEQTGATYAQRKDVQKIEEKKQAA